MIAQDLKLANIISRILTQVWLKKKKGGVQCVMLTFISITHNIGQPVIMKLPNKKSFFSTELFL